MKRICKCDNGWKEFFEVVEFVMGDRKIVWCVDCNETIFDGKNPETLHR